MMMVLVFILAGLAMKRKVSEDFHRPLAAAYLIRRIGKFSL